MSIHLRDSLIRFGAEAALPAVIVLAIIKESGPIITALVVSGRVAAGIGAELGSMKVTEQLDALEASAITNVGTIVARHVCPAFFKKDLRDAIVAPYPYMNKDAPGAKISLA